jgi:malate permease and related proteins
VARRPGWEPPQRGVLLTAGMTVNGSFPLPFVQALHGTDGVARLAAFDGLNTILTFSWAYYTAARANPLHDGGSILLDRVAKSPPLYGVAAGLAVNAAGWEVPAAVGDPIALFAGATGPLLSIGIGIMLRPPGVELRKAAAIVAVRLGTGLAVAVGVVLAFGLTGVDRAVLLLLGVSPVAFVTVAFASLENLDTKLATSTLSLAMAASLVLSSGIVLLAA